jgi:murein DD-endopeptidase MepM/ murein hydrolase activator NlpD
VNYRGLASIAVLSTAVLGATVVLFDVIKLNHTDNEPTFSMAPLSLGNPASAATLRTRNLAGNLVVDEEDAPLLPAITIPEPIVKTVHVKSGATLSGLLTGAGIERVEAARIVTTFSEAFNPRKIRAGQNLDLFFMPSDDDSPDQFVGLAYEPTVLRTVRVKRIDDGFSAWEEEKVLTTERYEAHGRIDDSLYMAGVRANLPVPVLIELIRAYSWDVDFQRSIRKGDGFAVLYEAQHDESGEILAYGDILFAELELSGDKLPIYQFKTGEDLVDYFDDKGRSAKKTLMRTPIDGARLSSGFGNRKHPVLGYNKMHKGVDFAAARGTPIYAAGDGAIDYAGWQGGYGKYVRIRHNGEYKTAYAHMKSIASGMKTGKRVRQGQVIGYVGTTGRSTGPHLHYEILKNGRQVNPMKVKMPSGQKLKGEDLERFLAVAGQLDKLYAEISGDTTVAQIEP